MEIMETTISNKEKQKEIDCKVVGGYLQNVKWLQCQYTA